MSIMESLEGVIYMEILYMWIENYNDIIMKQGFNFGGKYLFEFSNETLKCHKNDSYIEKFYGKNIRNITAVVGENGTGKTSLLEIIIRNLTKNLEYIQTKGIFVISENKKITVYVHENLEFNEEDSKNYLNQLLISNELSFDKIERFKMLDKINGKSNIINLDLKTTFIYFSNIYGKSIFKREFAYEDLTTVGLIEKYGIKSYDTALELYNLNEIKNQIKFADDFREKEVLTFNVPNEVNVFLVDLDKYYYLFKQLKYNENEIRKLKKKIKGSSKKYKYRFTVILCLILEKELNIEKGEITTKNDIYKYRDELVLKIYGDNIENKTKINNFIKYIMEIVKDTNRLINNSINFNINNNEQKEELERLLNSVIELEFSEKIFDFLWVNLSTGQQAFLNLFSRFCSVKEVKENVVILIDEGETYLHPKWQRNFIKNITSVIPEILSKNSISIKPDIQMIITSNTPFLISDLARENIIFLKNTNDNSTRHNNFELEQTFGANIHTLFKNSFFMESTMGEFAKNEINNVIQYLNKLIEESFKNDNKQFDLDEINKNFGLDKIKAYQIIQLIGEPIIKNKLIEMYEEVFKNETNELYLILKNLVKKYKNSPDQQEQIKSLLKENLYLLEGE